MKPDEPRLSGYDLRATFHFDPDGAWPRPGEVTAIVATAVTAAPPPTPGTAPPIRTVVLNPSRYLDQKVTITGQYSGRNLMGDLPDAPDKSRYDFVLRSADAAIWVSNMRPKMKDTNGKEFELALDSRIDSLALAAGQGNDSASPRSVVAGRRSRQPDAVEAAD